ncbi:MAG: hypothetical protein ACPGWR_22585 [Ardenticatenaceae bacterium]
MLVLPKNEQAGCLFYQKMNKQRCLFYLSRLKYTEVRGSFKVEGC